MKTKGSLKWTYRPCRHYFYLLSLSYYNTAQICYHALERSRNYPSFGISLNEFKAVTFYHLRNPLIIAFYTVMRDEYVVLQICSLSFTLFRVSLCFLVFKLFTSDLFNSVTFSACFNSSALWASMCKIMIMKLKESRRCTPSKADAVVPG